MSAATAEKSVAAKKSAKATKKAVKKTEEVSVPMLKKAPGEEFVTVGRRKCSVAKVRLSRGNGTWLINGKAVDKAQLQEDVRMRLEQPFRVIEGENGFDVRAWVSGGGWMGQTDAMVLGIARALEKVNAEWRVPLKKAGLLTRDSRIRERKKPGRPGARKRFQFSKR
jgi:small subunit ribosomal protein S9